MSTTTLPARTRARARSLSRVSTSSVSAPPAGAARTGGCADVAAPPLLLAGDLDDNGLEPNICRSID